MKTNKKESITEAVLTALVALVAIAVLVMIVLAI